MEDPKTRTERPDAAVVRQRLKQGVYRQLVGFFSEEAQRSGLTKAELAKRLNKDPSLISRLFQSPSNMTLETLADLLLAMGAEADPPAIVRIADRKNEALH